MKIIKLNIGDDVVCPYCHTNIITPEGYELQSGIGKCLNCEKEFRVIIEIKVNNDDYVSDNFPTIN